MLIKISRWLKTRNGYTTRHLELLNAPRHEQSFYHSADDIFKSIFLNEKLIILTQISLNFVGKDPGILLHYWLQEICYNIISSILTLTKMVLLIFFCVQAIMMKTFILPSWWGYRIALSVAGKWQHSFLTIWNPLQWRHTERDGISSHRRLERLLNRVLWRRSKKTSKLRVTCLCEGNSPVTGEFRAQRSSNTENVSMWWRHHAMAVLAPFSAKL